MKVIDGEPKYQMQDVFLEAQKKIMRMPKLKWKDGLFYTFDKFYKNFVLMESEFGYKRCFRYTEVLWDMR